MHEYDRLASVRQYFDRSDLQSEAWKADHNDAMRCYKLQEAIAFGTFIFGRICHLDEEVREDFLTNRMSFDQDLQKQIEDLYRQWEGRSREYIGAINDLEGKGYVVEGAKEFRRCYDEVLGILTPDDKFFRGGKLLAMREHAIDSCRRGEVEEMGV